MEQIHPYKNNVLDGKLLIYYPTGILMEETEYYENGKIRENSFKINGLYDSLFIGYYKDYNDGDVQNKCFYKNGLLDSIFIGYYPNGNVKVESYYVNDKVNGQYVVYFDINDTLNLKGGVKEIGKYENDIKIGNWKSFYPNGKLHTIGTFFNDQLEGEWNIYFENGKLKQCGNFLNGTETGAWNFGKAIRREIT